MTSLTDLLVNFVIAVLEAIDVLVQVVDEKNLVLRFRRRRLATTIRFFNSETKEGLTMIQLTDTQKAALSIQPVDAKGFPAPVDGAPSWSVSDPTVAHLDVAADGMSAELFADAPGSCQVNVSADADLGSGTVTISGALDVTVVPGQAATLNINTGAPEEQ